MEPSWLPQTAATLYSSGLSVCELLATLATEKSDVTKAVIRLAKAMATAAKAASAAPSPAPRRAASCFQRAEKLRAD